MAAHAAAWEKAMKLRLRSALLAGLLAATALGAGAQQLAYAAKTVNLRAGPDRAYPVVMVLAAGSEVVVQGCIADYRWCDVTFGYDRGWIYAGNLRTPWGESMLPVPAVAPYVGIVIAPFFIEDYWGLYYRNRPWYHERYRWAHPAPRIHAQPPAHVGPPPRHVGPPPGHVNPPPAHGGRPPGHGGTPPGHGGAPPGHAGPPPGHAGPPPGHAGPPPGHSGRPPGVHQAPQHGGPPHGGGDQRR